MGLERQPSEYTANKAVQQVKISKQHTSLSD